jgi:hypothetical protein
MRKDTATILIVSVLITALVMGGAYYLRMVSTAAAGNTSANANTKAKANALNSAIGTPDVPAGTPPARGNVIIQCTDPEVGEFFTNAATCDAADLSNRLSYSAPLVTTPNRDKYSGQGYVSPAQQAANSRVENTKKPNLRSQGKSPPAGLNVSCKFSVGMALEIERDLSATDDPRESTWRENYCKWRCEARQEKCPVADSYFYYRYEEMCGTYHLNQC